MSFSVCLRLNWTLWHSSLQLFLSFCYSSVMLWNLFLFSWLQFNLIPKLYFYLSISSQFSSIIYTPSFQVSSNEEGCTTAPGLWVCVEAHRTVWTLAAMDLLLDVPRVGSVRTVGRRLRLYRIRAQVSVLRPDLRKRFDGRIRIENRNRIFVSRLCDVRNSESGFRAK